MKHLSHMKMEGIDRKVDFSKKMQSAMYAAYQKSDIISVDIPGVLTFSQSSEHRR